MFNRCPYCKGMDISFDGNGNVECANPSCSKTFLSSRAKKDDYILDSSSIIKGMPDDDTFVQVYNKEKPNVNG